MCDFSMSTFEATKDDVTGMTHQLICSQENYRCHYLLTNREDTILCQMMEFIGM